MQDLSLHILDIVQNSITAEADYIEILITEDDENNRLTIKIIDNGKGMSPSKVKSVVDPFYTTRTTRKVGLGIPLFMAAAESCNGNLTIDSEVGRGTTVCAYFELNHIDRPPMGRMDDTLSTLILCNPRIDFKYVHRASKGVFELDTIEIKKTLGEVCIESPEVIGWIRSYIKEGLDEISGGV